MKPLFHAILQSFNPYAYPHLTEKRFSFAMRYFCVLLFFTLIATFILLIPALFMIPQYAQSRAANFDTLALQLDMHFTTPFVIAADPLIVADTNTSMRDATILLSNDALYYKSFILFGKEQRIPLDKTLDLKNDPSLAQSVGMVFFLLSPALFFWAFVFLSIYYWIMIALTFIIGLLLVWILRFSIRPSRIFKVALYASTIMILIQLLLFPFYRLFYIPLIAYWLLFILVLLTLRDSETPKGASQTITTSKSRDIFADDHNQRGGLSRQSAPRQDSYDVDERGNLKSGPKRKKSFDEENDGYMTLK